MNRREAIAAMFGASVANIVDDVKQVTPKTRLIIFSVREGVDCSSEQIDSMREEVMSCLKEAGLEGVEVMLVLGMDVDCVEGG